MRGAGGRGPIYRRLGVLVNTPQRFLSDARIVRATIPASPNKPHSKASQPRESKAKTGSQNGTQRGSRRPAAAPHTPPGALKRLAATRKRCAETHREIRPSSRKRIQQRQHPPASDARTQSQPQSQPSSQRKHPLAPDWGPVRQPRPRRPAARPAHPGPAAAGPH